MTYKDTLDWLFKQLPMYQKQGKSAYKKDLSNSIKLAQHLNNPQQNFKSIHVGGTNGKGSTSHMLASVLQEAGYKVGLYTSPHLKDFRERIKLNGKPVSKQFVIGFVKKHHSFFKKHKLSFFEMTVGMAFAYFSKKQVDIAIIEVGLGGRLDSTNIITPEIAIITNIGLDHTQFLGNTLTAIAKEKAGIIKPKIPIVIGETNNETKPVFKNTAKRTNSKLYFADAVKHKTYSLDLKGNYQSKNLKTALQTIHLLKENGFKLNEKHLKNGLKNVIKNTGLRGRWDILQTSPIVICDTAHNKEGLSIAIKQLLSLTFKRLHIVLGVVNDKDLESILPLFPKKASYYFCKPNIVRGLNANKLQDEACKFNLKGNSFPTVKRAYNAVLSNAKTEDLIFIGGSTFTVAEVI